MADIIMDYAVVGNIGTNCYIIINKETKECIIFDPGDDPKKICDVIEKNKCIPKAIMLTHGHYDHIYAVDELRHNLNIQVYAYEEEKEVLENTALNLSEGTGRKVTVKADIFLKDNVKINVAGMDIVVLHTPGHTKGGCCYYFKDAGFVISGDTLFAGSVGRTDFPTGSMSQIVRSVKEKLMVLPVDTKVFPGHGESTSIAYEAKYNPFIQN